MAFSFSLNNQNGNNSQGFSFGSNNAGANNNNNNNNNEGNKSTFSFSNTSSNTSNSNLNNASNNKGPSFSFGNQNTNSLLGTKGGSFNFNNKVDANTPQQKLNLNGQQPNNHKVTLGFGSGSDKKETGTGNPTFNFGNVSSKSVGNSVKQNTTESTSGPSFNFSASPSNTTPFTNNKKISIGSSTPNAASANKPLFTFGGASASNNSKISFGSTNNDTPKGSNSNMFSLDANNASGKSTGVKGAMDIKSSTSHDIPTKVSQNQPKFPFGNKNSASSNTDSNTFSATNTSKGVDAGKRTEISAPVGSDAKKPLSNAPKFSFGTTNDSSTSDSTASVSKPSFSFGAKTLKSAETKSQSNLAAASGKSSGFTFNASKNTDASKITNEKDKTKDVIPEAKANSDKSVPVKVEDFKPKQVSITNKNLDDLINKWTNQLSSASKVFKNYSEKIRSWDDVMVSSSEKITKLYSDSLECENKQNKIDQTLSYIEKQQEELDRLLTGYERQSESLLASSKQNGSSVTETTAASSQDSGAALTNDQVREKSYKLAEILEMRLNSLGTNFSSLITEVNKVNDNFNRSLLTSNSKTQEEEGLLEDVLKLLNNHLESLNWVEESERGLRKQVDEMRKSSI